MMIARRLFLAAFLVVTVLPVRTTFASVLPCKTPAWRMVYRHDADGGVLAGKKTVLLDAIRRGDPVRVAWGLSATRDGVHDTVEHTADPVFVSIIGGTDVVVQLPEHIGQARSVRLEAARLDRPAVLWRGLVTTQGVFDAVWVDRGTGEEVRRVAKRAGVAWFAFAPAPGCDTRSPLTLAVPGGARRDADRAEAVRPRPTP